MNSLSEIKRRHLPKNTYKEVREHLNRWDRFALWITTYVGTTGFFLILGGWTLFWVGWNFFAPSELLFDKPMDFVAWSFACNVIQILLLPLLLAGQNLQSLHEEARGKQDLELDERAEKRVELVLRELKSQNKMLKALLEGQRIKPEGK